MAYESKIYIVERNKTTNFAEAIATLRLGAMGRCFVDVFTNELDFELYLDGDGDRPVITDAYGDVPKYAPLEKVKGFVATLVKHIDYRRIKVLNALLDGFDESEWGELLVVHMGY